MTIKLISYFQNRTKDGVLTHGLMFFCISVFVAFFNFLFNVIMGRLLGGEGFGILVPLLSVFYILSVPGRTIQMISSKYITIYNNEPAQKKNVFCQLFKTIFIFSLILFLFVIVFSVKLQFFLHLNSPVPIYILAFILAAYILLPVFIGAVQGLQQFTTIGMSQLLPTIVRILSGVILVQFGLSYNGALAASFFAALTGILILYFVVRKNILLENTNSTTISLNNIIKIKDIFKEFIPVFLIFFFFQILAYADDIVVRHYLTSKAGIYSAANRIGKMLFFIAPAISMVVFPKITSARHDLQTGLRLLIKGLILTLLLGVFAEIIFIFFSEEIILLLFEKEYLESACLIKYLIMAVIPYSLVLIFINYFIATNNYQFIITLFILTVLQISGYILFHDTLIKIISVMAVIGILLLAISMVMVVYGYKQSQN